MTSNAGGRMRKNVFFWIWMLIGVQGLICQPLSSLFSVDAWQTEQGLPQNSVLTIAQSPDGYLWLGTYEGLVQFDGIKMKVLDRVNAPFRSNHIWSLCAASDSSLWIGFRAGGVVRWKDGRSMPFREKGIDSTVDVFSILEGQDKNLWFGTSNGLRMYDGRSFVKFDSADQSTYVFALCEGRDRTIWVGTANGLFFVKNGRMSRPPFPFDRLDEGVGSICEDIRGNIWVGTLKNGLFRFLNGRVTQYTVANGLPSNNIRQICEGTDGSVWIATNGGGVRRFSGEKMSRFEKRNGLSSDFALAVFQDREENIWIGTDGGGVNRIRRNKFTTYSTDEGLSENVVLSVFQDRAGSLWIGTGNGGLNVLKPDGTLRKYSLSNGLVSNTVRSVLGDEKGDIWIGTPNGLQRMSKGSFVTYTEEDGLADNFVRSLLIDAAGTLWVGTSTGLHRFLSGRPVEFNPDGRLKGTGINVVFEDRERAIWIGTMGRGLWRWKDGILTKYGIPEGFSSAYVRAIYEDSGGSLWIGTNGEGLFRFKNRQFAKIGTKEGLHDNSVHNVFEDHAGNLWMSSNKGVFYASRKELERLADGTLKTVHCTSFGKSDGLKSIECNGGNQPSAWKGRDGTIWYPTLKGVAWINPASIKKNTVSPPVAIESILVDRSTGTSVAGSVIVPPGSMDLEFHYTSLSFSAPEKSVFKYMLQGFDKEWIEAGTRRSTYYTNVPPGEYTFRVLAANNDGIWNNQGAWQRIIVRPYFYQTTWFLSILILFVVAALLGIHRWRIREHEKRELDLQKRVQEALGQVKSLSGLLPICSSCKKIRNDRGYWDKLEEYLESHTDASFSHGLCPDCIPLYFPGYVAKGDKNVAS